MTEIDGKKYIFESSTSAEHKGKVYKSTMVRYKRNGISHLLREACIRADGENTAAITIILKNVWFRQISL